MKISYFVMARYGGSHAATMEWSVWMLLVAAVLGCSGSVEVIGEEKEPGGGSEPIGAPNPLCDVGEPEGALDCSPSEEGESCTFACVDSIGQRLEADCQGKGCFCMFNSQSICSCTYNEPGRTCWMVHRSCCPAPWP